MRITTIVAVLGVMVCSLPQAFAQPWGQSLARITSPEDVVSGPDAGQDDESSLPRLVHGEHLRGDKSKILGNAANIVGTVSPGLTGDVSGLSGLINGLTGIANGVRGDVSFVTGNMDYVSGDVSGLVGDLTGLSGWATGIVADTSELWAIPDFDGNLSTVDKSKFAAPPDDSFPIPPPLQSPS